MIETPSLEYLVLLSLLNVKLLKMKESKIHSLELPLKSYPFRSSPRIWYMGNKNGIDQCQVTLKNFSMDGLKMMLEKSCCSESSVNGKLISSLQVILDSENDL